MFASVKFTRLPFVVLAKSVDEFPTTLGDDVKPLGEDGPAPAKLPLMPPVATVKLMARKNWLDCGVKAVRGLEEDPSNMVVFVVAARGTAVVVLAPSRSVVLAPPQPGSVTPNENGSLIPTSGCMDTAPAEDVPGVSEDAESVLAIEETGSPPG
jgi:hypothetical protein